MLFAIQSNQGWRKKVEMDPKYLLFADFVILVKPMDALVHFFCPQITQLT